MLSNATSAALVSSGIIKFVGTTWPLLIFSIPDAPRPSYEQMRLPLESIVMPLGTTGRLINVSFVCPWINSAAWLAAVPRYNVPFAPMVRLGMVPSIPKNVLTGPPV